MNDRGSSPREGLEGTERSPPLRPVGRGVAREALTDPGAGEARRLRRPRTGPLSSRRGDGAMPAEEAAASGGRCDKAQKPQGPGSRQGRSPLLVGPLWSGKTERELYYFASIKIHVSYKITDKLHNS